MCETILPGKWPPQADHQMLRWTSQIWPGNRESWFLTGCWTLGNNLDWWEAQWGNKGYLEPLLDSTTRFGKAALTVLALGLACKDPAEGTLAGDAVAIAVADGRLNSERIASVLNMLFNWPGIKLSRATGRLLQTSRVSKLHATAIRDAVIYALTATPRPPDSVLGDTLELLYEVLSVTGTRELGKELFDFLGSIRGSNKAAKLAKKIGSLG